MSAVFKSASLLSLVILFITSSLGRALAAPATVDPKVVEEKLNQAIANEFQLRDGPSVLIKPVPYLNGQKAVPQIGLFYLFVRVLTDVLPQETSAPELGLLVRSIYDKFEAAMNAYVAEQTHSTLERLKQVAQQNQWLEQQWLARQQAPDWSDLELEPWAQSRNRMATDVNDAQMRHSNAILVNRIVFISRILKEGRGGLLSKMISESFPSPDLERKACLALFHF